MDYQSALTPTQIEGSQVKELQMVTIVTLGGQGRALAGLKGELLPKEGQVYSSLQQMFRLVKRSPMGEEHGTGVFKLLYTVIFLGFY